MNGFNYLPHCQSPQMKIRMKSQQKNLYAHRTSPKIGKKKNHYKKSTETNQIDIREIERNLTTAKAEREREIER